MHWCIKKVHLESQLLVFVLESNSCQEKYQDESIFVHVFAVSATIYENIKSKLFCFKIQLFILGLSHIS